MRVPVKLLGFVFWLFFFNCGRCQVLTSCACTSAFNVHDSLSMCNVCLCFSECRREDITLEHTERAAKASYEDGESVSVICVPGFTGRYRLKCAKGKWTQLASSRPCAKKKCSHPGDTPNGQFIIKEGSEFVFGATVLYTCKKGFEMTTRINQRTCRAGGWDNTVPVCEAVKCPAIHTDNGVTASGNTEEGSYGDVIHFECVSSDKKLDGSSEIHCTDTGAWSGPVPTCKEITCTAPDILNGEVIERVQEYRKDAILKYRCKEGFKPREGSPRCAKFGWTLNPECDEITCVLPSTPFGVKQINPAGKTIFRAGERVEITCAENHWFRTREYTHSFTCRDDGQWDHQPVCEEIRCEVPRNQHVYWSTYYFSGDKRLGVKISYSCEDGYVRTAAEATCTRDGWTPNPLCAERMCAAPNIPNAEIVGDRRPNYRINSRIQYKCKTGFEPERPVQITCNSWKEWTGIQQCTANKNLCPDPSVENGLIYNNRDESTGKLIYSCNTGYKPFSGNWWDSVICSRGSLSEEPRCIPVGQCGALPSVHNGKLKQTSHDQGPVEVECDPGFKPTQPLIKCVNGTWETPVCEDVHCKVPPKVENALITSKPEASYAHGSRVTYVCQKSFSMNGKRTVLCRNGIWEETPTCEAVGECGALPSVDHGKLKQTFPDQGPVEVECVPGFKPTQSLIKCVNGTWETPVCEAVGQCGALPSVHRGKLKQTSHDQGPVEVECDPGFKPTQPLIKCVNGTWETPVCEGVRCGIPPNVENALITSKPEESYPEGSSVTYVCQKSFSMNGKSTVFCLDGIWEELPTCKAEKNVCRDLSVENGFTYRLPSNENEIFYSCNTGYKTFSGNWWDSVTCSRGSLSEEPRCIPVGECGALPSVHRGKLKQTSHDQGPVEVECVPGFIPTQPLIKCVNGTWETPVCEGVRCGIPPKVENTLITSKPEEFYAYGSSVKYVCQKSFSMNGKSTVSCRNGIWEEPPTCEEITCKLKSTIIGMKKINPEGKTVFRARERVEITCAEKRSTKESIKSFTCRDDGQWDHEPVCVEIRCEVPRDQNVLRPDIYFKGDSKLGETRNYYCTSEPDLIDAEATCTEDGWTPKPLCADPK
ncbi:complement factor H-like [Pseudorasbora parva]|uniref:complement factor H-like n=1 Tax=Pseudorasbora parva TaxID=51549 RepID=UPI00351E4063